MFSYETSLITCLPPTCIKLMCRLDVRENFKIISLNSSNLKFQHSNTTICIYKTWYVCQSYAYLCQQWVRPQTKLHRLVPPAPRSHPFEKIIIFLIFYVFWIPLSSILTPSFGKATCIFMHANHVSKCTKCPVTPFSPSAFCCLSLGPVSPL